MDEFSQSKGVKLTVSNLYPRIWISNDAHAYIRMDSDLLEWSIRLDKAVNWDTTQLQEDAQGASNSFLAEQIISKDIEWASR